MMSLSVATEHAKSALESGAVADVAAANVLVVRLMGVRMITSRLPKDVRSSLMAAVKAGELGRLPKDGLQPEAFFHPNAMATAKEWREREARKSVEALRAVFVPASEVVDR